MQLFRNIFSVYKNNDLMNIEKMTSNKIELAVKLND